MSQPPLIKLGQGRDESDLPAWVLYQRANDPAAVPGDNFWNGFLSGIGCSLTLGLITVSNIYAGIAVFAVGLGLVLGITIMKRIHQQKGLK